MIAVRAYLAGALLLPGAALAADAVPVPSGQPVTFVESVWGEPGPAGLTARFRFVAPELAREGEGVDFARIEPDLQHLCESFVLPRLSPTGPQVAQVIVSLSDRPIEFGQSDPSITQVFEAFRPENGTCIWEAF